MKRQRLVDFLNDQIAICESFVWRATAKADEEGCDHWKTRISAYAEVLAFLDRPKP